MVIKGQKTKRIGKHYFRLLGKPNLYVKSQILVSFTPIRKTKNSTNRSILPTYNDDRKHYTCAFSLPSSPPETGKQVLAQHNKRVAESTVQIHEMLMPKPRSKNKYCGVCRSHYQDYKQHIQGDQHLLMLKKSIFQSHIVQLCLDYQPILQAFQKREAEESKANNCQLSSQQIFKSISTESTDINGSLKKREGDMLEAYSD